MPSPHNLKEEALWTYIPPNSMPIFKLTIERSDGTVDDVTADVTDLEVEDYITESIGAFKFTIVNPNNKYTGLYNGNEIVRYYKDYAATATTLRFRGRIEKPSYKGFQLSAEGRSESLKFMTLNVNKNYTATECSVILLYLISSYGSGFTSTNVNASGVTLTVNWSGKPFWDCVKDLCTASGFDCYVDANLDFHFYEQGSVSNATDCVVHGLNLFDVNDFTPDTSEVRNKIIVIGAEQEGVQILYTAEDSTSQTAYGEKEEIIKDDNVTSYNQAVDAGDYELSIKKDPPIYGSVTCPLMATIQPGERVFISVPDDNLHPGLYLTTGYKDGIDWNNGDYKTEVLISKEKRKISKVLSDRVQNENSNKSTNLNPNGLLQAFTFLYNTDEGTHTNTSISSGYLIPGAVNGYWTSPERALSSNLSEAYLLMVGDQLDQVTVQVSGNNGVSYQTIANKGLIAITTAAGVTLKVKVTFLSTSLWSNTFIEVTPGI